VSAASNGNTCMAPGSEETPDMSDIYRYSDSGAGYLLLMTPPWTPTAGSLHPLLSAAAAARRRFVRHGREGPPTRPH
jgi:hypothetical protein